jgi:aspartokinase
LEDFTFENSDTLSLRQADLMKAINNERDTFYTFCHGVNESTIITSKSVSERIKTIFSAENLKSQTSDLASITIKLPTVNTEISGVYYFILKHLAWEGINIVEVISTSNEFTVVVKSDDIDSAFSVLMQLKKEGKLLSNQEN